eukprot:NODE_507_length_2389_cov_19.817741_g481_i0.p1 GENE.NODE_507_length_2389_cov_19.817741_g481_i0~~NODE_507_length_2389_cov_19.817741_g481_i0.p1  ORF type:complete len:728 (+),score=168.52 NODE_507_length_2389_cov_19.817741_g481_i0:76-2259(+)
MASWEERLVRPQSVVTRVIEFRKASKADPQDVLRSSLIPLNKLSEQNMFLAKKLSQKKIVDDDDDDPTRPQFHIYDPQKIEGLMKWRGVKGVGAGLHNMGNTRYMNAVLQVLAHIAPFRNYVASIGKSQATRHQDVQGFDPYSSLQKLFDEMSSANRRAILPEYLYTNIKRLSPLFRKGNQEDAAEFAVQLLDACHCASLRAAGGVIDRKSAVTTAIHQIFGGYFCSKVEWSKEEEVQRLEERATEDGSVVTPSNNNYSVTYDPFLLFDLELKGGTLEKCLNHFTRSEVLDGEEMYRTPSGVYLKATRRMLIHRPPRVLSLVLKRFSVHSRNQMSTKIMLKARFPEYLDMKRYCSEDAKGTMDYRLDGVVVHVGDGPHSGQYHSYVRASNGLWFLIDDETVKPCSNEVVLSEQAYMLFYVRVAPEEVPNKRIIQEVPKPTDTVDPVPEAQVDESSLMGEAISEDIAAKLVSTIKAAPIEPATTAAASPTPSQSTPQAATANLAAAAKKPKKKVISNVELPQVRDLIKAKGPKKTKQSRKDADLGDSSPETVVADHKAIPEPTKQKKKKKKAVVAAKQALQEAPVKLVPMDLRLVLEQLPDGAGSLETSGVWENTELSTADKKFREDSLAELGRLPGKQRDWSEIEWDEAYDAGKQRKVKKAKIEQDPDAPNPFQRMGEYTSALKRQETPSASSRFAANYRKYDKMTSSKKRKKQKKVVESYGEDYDG